MAQNNRFYKYSFSGADVTNAAWFSLSRDGTLYNSAPVEFDSLTTVSISVHEAKSPVRALGHRAVKGFAGSVRSIAGQMIMTIINDHPLRTLMEEYKIYRQQFGPWMYSIDQGRDGSGFISGRDTSERIDTLPTIIPPFNIVFNAVTELAALQITNSDGSIQIDQDAGRSLIPFCQLALFGVEFMDDNLVLSTNNPMSENAFSFVAQDYAVMTEKTGFLGPLQIAERAAKSKDTVFLPGEDLDKQNIWMASLGLRQKPGDSIITYLRDEEGNIVGIETHQNPFSDDPNRDLD